MTAHTNRGRGLGKVIFPQDIPTFKTDRIVLSDLWQNLTKINPEDEEEVIFGGLNFIQCAVSPASNVHNNLLVQTPRFYCPFPPSKGFEGKGDQSLQIQYPNDWESIPEMVEFHTFIKSILRTIRQLLIRDMNPMGKPDFRKDVLMKKGDPKPTSPTPYIPQQLEDDAAFYHSFFKMQDPKYAPAFYAKLNNGTDANLATQFFLTKGSEQRRVTVAALPQKFYLTPILHIKWVYQSYEEDLTKNKFRIRVDNTQGLYDESGLTGQGKKKPPCVIQVPSNQTTLQMQPPPSKKSKKNSHKNPFEGYTLDEQQSGQVLVPIKQQPMQVDTQQQQPTKKSQGSAKFTIKNPNRKIPLNFQPLKQQGVFEEEELPESD